MKIQVSADIKFKFASEPDCFGPMFTTVYQNINKLRSLGQYQGQIDFKIDWYVILPR